MLSKTETLSLALYSFVMKVLRNLTKQSLYICVGPKRKKLIIVEEWERIEHEKAVAKGQ